LQELVEIAEAVKAKKDGEWEEDQENEINEKLSEIMVETKMKNLEIISIQATIGYLVASEDASDNCDHEKSMNLITVLSYIIEVFVVIGKDHETINTKWKTLL